MIIRHFALVAVLGIAGCTTATAQPIPAVGPAAAATADYPALPVPRAMAERGVQRFLFSGWAGPALPVWYVRPAGTPADAPILFVFHGVQRDADRYLSEWLDVATRERVIVVVPEFTREGFPGAPN